VSSAVEFGVGGSNLVNSGESGLESITKLFPGVDEFSILFPPGGGIIVKLGLQERDPSVIWNVLALQYLGALSYEGGGVLMEFAAENR
jgi:hypothetical protein